jgi:hypothetical protein
MSDFEIAKDPEKCLRKMIVKSNQLYHQDIHMTMVRTRKRLWDNIIIFAKQIKSSDFSLMAESKAKSFKFTANKTKHGKIIVSYYYNYRKLF